MGDPRKHRKKFEGPKHPWNKARIDQEKVYKKEYGLTNKKEIWKMVSLLKNFTDQAKRLTTASGAQADKEQKQLMDRLQRLGLLQAGAHLDDVLGLKVENIMDRRLQTVVFKKGLARTIKQARQFIVHEHIFVGVKKIGVPSYIVPVADEARISFAVTSAFVSETHPERKQPEQKVPSGKVVEEEIKPAEAAS